jgi:hypothetical protein
MIEGHALAADHVTPRRVQPASKRPAGDECQPVVAFVAQHARVVESHDARCGDAVDGPAPRCFDRDGVSHPQVRQELRPTVSVAGKHAVADGRGRRGAVDVAEPER